MSTFAASLARLRRERRISQTELAERLGLAKSTISMYESGKREPNFETIAALAELLGVTPGQLIDEAPALPPGVSPISRRRVPILGSIAAGQPIFASEEHELYASCDQDVHCDFALRVSGDSMSPRLLDGDVVFIRQQDDVDDGQIAAVLIDDTATLKHVYHLSGGRGVQLVSDNPAYPPMLFTRENSDTLRILGLAVACQRRL